MFCMDLIQMPIFVFNMICLCWIAFHQLIHTKFLNQQFHSKISYADGICLIYFLINYMKQNMEKQSVHESRKRRHKSEFIMIAKTEGRFLKPKRLSCMRASEFLQIEESQTQVANFFIQQILKKVFNFLGQANKIAQICTQQITYQADLLNSYQLYTMTEISSEMDEQIRLEEEPRTQPNYKVIQRKDKQQQSSQVKDSMGQEFNKTNSSNSKNKFYKKQRLYKNTNNLSTNHLSKSNHSIHSIKSNKNNSYSIANLIPKRIEQEIENEKEKDKRLREQIIKKLMRQHQTKLKENPHPCPEPLLHQYRSFFAQPETKEEENLRVSYLQLRQIRIAQQKANQRKPSKKLSTFISNGQNTQRSNTNSLHLPKIQKSAFGTKKQQGTLLFTQDDNGKVIKVKNNQRGDTRQHSNTTYESYVKPRETALKEISNIYKANIEYLKNDKIKDETSYLNENTSIVSTLCHSITVDEQIMDKSILQNFVQKKGIMMKKSMFQQRSTKSIETSGLKLPSIMKRK